MNTLVQRLVCPPVIGWPDICLLEAHAIEMPRRHTVEAVGQLLRIREGTAIALHQARFAADIIGNTPVARGMGVYHRDAVTRRETPWARRCRAHGRASISALIAAMRASISARLVKPFSSSGSQKASARRSK